LFLAGKQRRHIHGCLAQSGELSIDPVWIFTWTRDRHLELSWAAVAELPLIGRSVDLAAA
jgi:hypothetical protein